jgi:prevent-host-death family protein
MPIIRPMSELRNKTKEIREICKSVDEPVFLTHNGHGHLVIMSIDHYEQQLAKNGSAKKLAQGQAYFDKGGQGHSHAETIKGLRARARGR